MFENDDWEADEDYFKDFNADEVVKESQSVEKEKAQTSTRLRSSSQDKPSADDQQPRFHCNSAITKEKGIDSVPTGSTSLKSVVLDIFKSNDNAQKSSQKEISVSKPDGPNKKNLVLNILQNNNSSNVKSDISNKAVPTVKSVLKICDVDLEIENKNKRKKCVAFTDSNNEATASKKICISNRNHSFSRQFDNLENNKLVPTSAVNDDSSKFNNSKRQVLNILKSPSHKNTKVPLLKKTVIRKFPGPAGLLVDDSEESEIISVNVVDKSQRKNKKYSDVCSQNTKNLFTTGAWQLMTDDLPAGFELHEIATVKEHAVEYSKKYQKVPYLAGIIQCIDYKPNDPHVVLKDFTGKIDARIHHSICKLYPNALGTNVVILVKDVGVIVTSKKYVCIIISPKNLVSIYSDESRLVKTSHLESLLDNNDNCHLQESQISLLTEEDHKESKIPDKNLNHPNLHNLSPKKSTVLKDDSSDTLSKNFENGSERLPVDVNNSNLHGLNDHSSNEKNSKITDFMDDIQDFKFEEDESWFEVNVGSLNSFEAHQFPSSTPMIVNKEDSQKETIENTLSETMK